jgi:hypothetical protein
VAQLLTVPLELTLRLPLVLGTALAVEQAVALAAALPEKPGEPVPAAPLREGVVELEALPLEPGLGLCCRLPVTVAVRVAVLLTVGTGLPLLLRLMEEVALVRGEPLGRGLAQGDTLPERLRLTVTLRELQGEELEEAERLTLRVPEAVPVELPVEHTLPVLPALPERVGLPEAVAVLLAVRQALREPLPLLLSEAETLLEMLGLPDTLSERLKLPLPEEKAEAEALAALLLLALPELLKEAVAEKLGTTLALAEAPGLVDTLPLPEAEGEPLLSRLTELCSSGEALGASLLLPELQKLALWLCSCTEEEAEGEPLL